jgi:hypothetical protein
VNAIHAKEHAISLVTIRIDPVQGIRDLTQRKFQAGAGVHPSERKHPGRWCDRLSDAVDNLFLCDPVDFLIERDLANLCTCAL